MVLFRFFVITCTLALITLPCSAKIYKYQKDGVWYYTDAPPKENVGESKIIQDTEEIAKKLMVGTWYGFMDDYQFGMPVTRHWIATIYADGRHVTKCRDYAKGTNQIVGDYVRHGRWSYEGGVYHYQCEFLETEKGRMTRKYQLQYELIDISASRMVYKSAESETTYTFKRVKPDYEF